MHHWTARFEAKHKYFKHLANVLGNFTNICYSLALRHQLHQCYLAANSGTPSSEEIEVGPGNCFYVHKHSFHKWNQLEHKFILFYASKLLFPRICCGMPVNLVLEFNCRIINYKFVQVLSCTHACYYKLENVIHMDQVFFNSYSANWVRVKGTKYQTPCCLVIGKGESEEQLQFAKVINIYVNGQSVIFEVTLLVSHPFSHHHHAFPLSSPPMSSHCKYLIKQSGLLDYHPYGLYHASTVFSDLSLEYVVLRSNIYV